SPCWKRSSDLRGKFGLRATQTSTPKLVWRGKDEQDWSDLAVHAPPLYIQEKVQPKALIDDLLRTSKRWVTMQFCRKSMTTFANEVSEGDAPPKFLNLFCRRNL